MALSTHNQKDSIMARRKKNSGPSKMALVRAALAAKIEKPLAIVEHIKKQGVDISPNQVSNYKNVIKRKGPANGRRKGKRGRRMAQPAANGSGYADKIIQLKQLVQQLGADEVKKLAEVLG
jgi:hypothetical protein